MEERRTMKKQIDYTFEIESFIYTLKSDDLADNFVLSCETVPLVTIKKKLPRGLSETEMEFVPFIPKSEFKDSADQSAIDAAIAHLKDVYLNKETGRS